MLIYETGFMGMKVRVFEDRLEHTAGLMSAITTVPIQHIASVRVGRWPARTLFVQTTGGRKLAIATTRTNEVANAIAHAQRMIFGGGGSVGISTSYSALAQVARPTSHARRVAAGGLAVLALSVTVASVASSGASKSSANQHAAAGSAAVASTGNRANDMLLGLSESQQLGALEGVVKDGCKGVRVFYAGVSRDDRSASWDIACENGSQFSVQIAADQNGSTKILDCRAMKAIANVDCFVTLEAQNAKAPRSEQQVRADIARLPSPLKQQLAKQLGRSLDEPPAATTKLAKKRSTQVANHESSAAAPKGRALGPEDLEVPSE